MKICKPAEDLNRKRCHESMDGRILIISTHLREKSILCMRMEPDKQV